MARIRSVPPEICDLEELSAVSDFAERTFVRLSTHLDDEGRCRFNPKLLKAALYPLRDSVTADDLLEAVYELAGAGVELLATYNVDGALYIQCRPELWRSWQKPRHPSPSKLPAPPEGGCYTPPTAGRRNAPAGVPPQESDRRNPPAGVEWSGVGEGEVPPLPPSVDGGDTAVPVPDQGGNATANGRNAPADGGVSRETVNPRAAGINPRAQGTNPRSLAGLLAVDRTRDYVAFAAHWSVQVPDDPRFVATKAVEAFPGSPIDQQTAFETYELAVQRRRELAAEPAGEEMGG